jgi:RimK family alpha-L-glutamate ligase
MKVGLYQEIKDPSKPEKVELYNAIKRRSDITSVNFIAPNKLKIRVIDGVLTVETGDIFISKETFDLFIIRGGFKNKPLLIEFINFCRASGIKVYDNNFSEIKYLINKKADYVKFALNNIPVPNTYFYSSIDDFQKDNVKFPLVMKPTNTGKGFGVEKVKNLEEVQEILIETERSLEEFMFQDLIDYEHDLRVLVCGEKVLGAMKRIPRQGDFRANFSLGGTVEPFKVTPEIEELALRATKACGLLMSGVDVLVERNNGKLWILEANRTPGLEGITKAMGNEIADQVLEHMILRSN